MDKWLTHPTSLKIISLALGILLWAVVHFDPEAPPNQVASQYDTKVLEAVKIEARGLDGDAQHLKLIEPSVVRLLVEGTRTDLLSAATEDYKVWVDLSELSEGDHELVVRYELPPRIRLREMSPARVKATLVAVQTKEFELQIDTVGVPANGHIVGTPIVKPNSRVFVTLPKDQMDRVVRVAGAIDVEQVKETVVERKVRLAAYDVEGNEIEGAVLNPQVVEVEVPVTQPFKKLPLQIGFDGRLPSGLSIASFKPAVDAVTAFGPQEVLDALEYYDGLVVNLATIRSSGTLTLELAPSNGIAAFDPRTVDVDVEVEPTETLTLPGIPVSVVGLAEGLTAQFGSPEGGAIDLVVSGAPSVLAELTARDVQIIADVNGLPAGSHSIALDIHLPQFVDSGFAQPPVASIAILDGTETEEGGDGADDGEGDGTDSAGEAADADGADGGIAEGADGEADPGDSAPGDDGQAEGGESAVDNPPADSGDAPGEAEQPADRETGGGGQNAGSGNAGAGGTGAGGADGGGGVDGGGSGGGNASQP